MKSFKIICYGCQTNGHESDRLAHMLKSLGFKEALSAEESDVLIFQTCSIRNTAAQKILTHISQAKKIRAKKKLKQTICVIGCLSAEEKKYKEFDGVDIVLGTNQLETLVEVLCGEKPDTRFGVGHSIIIQHGCENFCSYCIVPFVRGKEYSRTVDEIVSEFHAIKDCGKVIYLLGQNVNSYFCPQTGTNFVGLLDKICAIEGDFLINFMSSHPKDFSDELIACIARNKKIERNIHLPMQSGCDKILKFMNRGYTVKEYLGKIDTLRTAVPGVRITTDIICGFPGETLDDYQETVKVFSQIKFNASFIFPYSRRTGTLADKMPEQIPDAEKRRRVTELLKIQRQNQTG